MRKLTLSLLGVGVMSLMPVIAGAAGTYYNSGLYQNPQRYGSNAGGYYNSYGSNKGNDNRAMQNMGTQKYTKQKSKQVERNNTTKQGFQFGAYFSHEFANWDFEMKEAGSKLRYDNVVWNVIGADGAYYFGSSLPMQIKFGARYGKQFGETSMLDDDISSGPYGYEDYAIGRVSGYAMSVGTSDNGTQMGFNASLGLTDFFSVGRAKLTPSIGYRYLKYELSTKNNSGLTMDVFDGNSAHPYVNCIEVGGETQCDPYVAFVNAGGQLVATGRVINTDGSLSEYIVAPAGETIAGVSLGDTYYYHQVGTSHKYETEWAGPYLALDMEYAINNNNMVNAGIEFGLPMYTSKGDQPYRIDWAHPTSVEDKGKFGKAYHLGLSALWSTALSDSTMLSLGMTYDYYRVNDAKASTYLNGDYYQEVYDYYKEIYDTYAEAIAAGTTLTDEQQAEYKSVTAQVASLKAQKDAGWKIESDNEIKSIYSSMGIRVGLNVKF